MIGALLTTTPSPRSLQMFIKNLTVRRVLQSVSFLISALMLWCAVLPESASAISVILSIRDVPVPFGVAFVSLQAGNKIYVSNPQRSTVTVIDERSHTIAGTIRVGDGPGYMAFNPQTNKLYVANSEAGGVSVINVLNDTVVKTVASITRPVQIKVDAMLKRVYVLSNNIIVVLDADTDEIINPPISIGFSPATFELLQSQVGNRHTLYVARGTAPSLAVVDARTQSEIVSLTLPTAGRDIAVDPLAMRVYVLGFNRYLTVVDANTNRIVSSFQISGEVVSDPLSLVADPQRQKLYVLFTDRIFMLDAGPGPGVRDFPQVPVEGGATTIALHPTNHRLYVANHGNDKVQVIGNDLSSLTLDVGAEGIFTSGRNGTLRVTVRNKERGVSEGEVRVVIWLPQGLTFASGGGGDWGCSAAEQVVTCTSFRPIKSNEASSFKLSVAVSDRAVPFADVSAAVANESDGNASDNQFGPLTIKTGGAGIDVAVDGAQGGVFRPGTTGTYDLSVGNVGTAATTAPVELTSVLPDGMSFAGFVGAGWACAASGQEVTCTHPASIASGVSRPLTISASVTNRVQPESINMVSVFSEGDANTYNNWVPLNTKSAPADSGFLISSEDGFVGPASSAGTVSVTAGPSAGSWAASSSPWIHIVSGSTGNGNGEVRFTTEANTTASPRNGTVNVAGLTHQVLQASSVAGPTVRYVTTFDEDVTPITTELNAADSRSQFNPSRNSEYFDLCGLSRAYGAALQVTSTDFNPQMFLYDSAGRLVAHSMPSYEDREGDATTWLPGFTNVSGNNFNIGFFRFPLGEKYTLEVTADPTPQNPNIHGFFRLRILKSLRDVRPGMKSPVETTHTLAPLPFDRANGTFLIEDFLNADLRRHYVIDMILKSVNVSGLDARMVKLPELGFQMFGQTRDFFSFNTTGTFKMFDPPDQFTGSKYVGGGTFNGNVFSSDLTGRVFHNLQSRDFLLETSLRDRCTVFELEPSGVLRIGPGETTGTITITRQPGCDWVACSDSSWIQLTSTPHGSGSGTLIYKVSSFNVPGLRLGGIHINDMFVQIDQHARLGRRRRPPPTN
jgi:uncharacterized repeat protein (TIGR01451 family)